MRKSFALAASLLALQMLASSASAQCCGIIPPPQAPDMFNTRGMYQTNCFGMTYGPTYSLRPPFAPFQGAIGPVQGYPAASGDGPQGPAGFPSHLYARSPRDFFMVDTDPRSSPYSYGYVTPYDRLDRASPYTNGYATPGDRGYSTPPYDRVDRAPPPGPLAP